MGEAKRRKDLDLPPREKEIIFPEFNKKNFKRKLEIHYIISLLYLSSFMALQL